MVKQKTYEITKKGLKMLKDELTYREGELKLKIANTLEEMCAQGDLSENDGYSMAKEEQKNNEERIIELKEKIKNARVAEDANKSIVGIGDTVTLNGKATLKYQITGEEEANPFEGKISYLSPIGKAVMNKKVGDMVTISTPKGDNQYTVEGIE